MIKLIATDMDGTFLDSNKQFSPEFSKIFFELKEKGIRFAIASGNQYYRLYQKFLPMSTNMIFIAENGAYIADGETRLYCNIIDRDIVNSLIERINAIPRVFGVVCGIKSAYILNKYKEYEYIVLRHYSAYQFVDDFSEIDDEIMKIAVFDSEFKNWEIYEQIKEYVPENIKLVTSGNEWMDIMNAEINKGVAMNFIQMIYEIEKDECAAFGDQMNDFELLKEVKYAYAMSNAVDAIKEIAYEVVLSNDEQGVIQKIKELLKEID